MENKLLMIIILFIVFFFISCSNQKKIIIYEKECGEEVVQDLEYSVDMNNDYMKDKKIIIEFDTIQSKCGYAFFDGGRNIYLKGVLTDVEFKEEIKKFFSLK